ncbi:hypothetical protein [Streptomyces sp. SYP-A7185]|uniref:hypothetical protein n=1 Tax=Streptomyces sp. SYP-A7185 TaxID=3040076 RepID=UPI0038F741ED
MTIRNVERHDVPERSIAQALEDIEGRTLRRWHTMRYDCYSDAELQAMCEDLLDHFAACTVTGPQLSGAPSSMVLRTAAECALGFLDLGCCPDGDQEISFPLVDEKISSEDLALGDAVEHASTAKDWLDAFALGVISGAIWERDRVIGLLLRDQASMIHDGLPYSRLKAESDPAELAEMDTLVCYLTEASGHLPREWPSVTLCRPQVDERLDAALRLDALGALTPDQQLLRVLVKAPRPRRKGRRGKGRPLAGARRAAVHPHCPSWARRGCTG